MSSNKDKNNNKNNDSEYEDDSIKVILVGESGGGKTSLINSIQGNQFTEGGQISTMSCSFIKLTRKILNEEYSINLWDTIGQERFRSLTKIFMNNSKIVIFVFDITSKESFDELNYWFDTIQNELGDEPIKALAANKQDLFEEQAVDDETIQELADKKGLPFSYTSAMNPIDFNNFLDKLLEKYIKEKGNDIKKMKKLRKCKQKKKACC